MLFMQALYSVSTCFNGKYGMSLKIEVIGSKIQVVQSHFEIVPLYRTSGVEQSTGSYIRHTLFTRCSMSSFHDRNMTESQLSSWILLLSRKSLSTHT
jgi:hypothetical protein